MKTQTFCNTQVRVF